MHVPRPSDPARPVQGPLCLLSSVLNTNLGMSKANASTPDVQSFEDEDTYAETYPEGGKDAWLVVAGAWCAMIPSMGVLNTLAVLQAWVSEHELEGMSESTIGWVFSTYAFFLYFCGAQVGVLSPHT